MIRYLRHRWGAEGGYREFLTLAIPLILSTAAWSVQHFVDRVFLAWYSTEALAAALPAGMANFVIASLFIGVASYVNTFVAQYVGAKRLERVGPAVWQGAYLAVLSGLVGLGVAWQSGAIFDLVGHDTAIRDEEVVYFRILCYGLFPLILSTTASCFFSGRGKTLTVLAVNASATALNIALDYGLIFGHWGLPAWGIRGAAWATNIAALFSAVLFGVLLLQRRYRDEFDTLGGWRPDRDLFLRLLRFGGPNGLNYMFDMVAFSFFILVVGRKGTLELTATNLAFSVNSLAFMPLLGGGIAVSTMVGQRLGRDDPDAAEYCTWPPSIWARWPWATSRSPNSSSRPSDTPPTTPISTGASTCCGASSAPISASWAWRFTSASAPVAGKACGSSSATTIRPTNRRIASNGAQRHIITTHL